MCKFSCSKCNIWKIPKDFGVINKFGETANNGYINRSKNGEKQIMDEGMKHSYFCAVKDGKNKHREESFKVREQLDKKLFFFLKKQEEYEYFF